MNKLKIAELIILAISALTAAIKSALKFIDYLGKLRQKKPAAT